MAAVGEEREVVAKSGVGQVPVLEHADHALPHVSNRRFRTAVTCRCGPAPVGVAAVGVPSVASVGAWSVVVGDTCTRTNLSWLPVFLRTPHRAAHWPLRNPSSIATPSISPTYLRGASTAMSVQLLSVSVLTERDGAPAPTG